MHYRRTGVAGATYFFTVNLAERNRTLLTDHADVLRAADWPYSSIHRYIAAGTVTRDWGAGEAREGGQFGEF